MDELNKSYELFIDSIHHINSLLAVLNYNDIIVLFLYHVISLMDEIEMLNNKVFSRYLLKCSLFMVEDLKLVHQKKNFRYHRLYRIESKSIDRLNALKKTLEFYSFNRRLSSQFMIFFMPLKHTVIANRIAIDNKTEMIQNRKKRNMAQRIIFTDLSKDKEAFKKFMKLTFKGQVFLAFTKMNIFFAKKIRTPLVLTLNIFQSILFKIVLISLFFVDWVKIIFFIFFSF